MGDVGGNDRGVPFQGGDVTASHLGRRLVADVQELAKMRIVGLARRVVTQRRGKGVAVPAGDRLRRGQCAAIDVNYGSVGAHNSSNRRHDSAYTALAISRPSRPATVKPMSSSNHVVPAVFKCTPAPNFFSASCIGR